MGLDITAYEGLTPSRSTITEGDWDPIDPETGKYNEHTFVVNVNPHFPGRNDHLTHRSVWDYRKKLEFRAGSYGGYNCWREELAKLARYPATEREKYGREESRHDVGCWKSQEGPFYELINFSDCEGTIGPRTAEKLSRDFFEYDELARKHSPEFYETYQKFNLAFVMAVNNGAVYFH